MSDPSIISATGLPHYNVPENSFDELGRGHVPDHWHEIMAFFSKPGDRSDAIQPEQIRSEMLVRDLDVQRPTRLDPIPFTVPAAEWALLEQGLTQRARLLNQITADLYGARTLLNVGGLPPALVFGNPRFLLPLHNYKTLDDQYLQLLAFDIGRSPDGQWRVLADWTEAPEGLGMSLENRVLAGQALPELFQRVSTQRIAAFYRAFAEHLADTAAATTQEGITVLMSPGPDHPNYFEHTYLGQYFGLPVVEGADLTVRGNTLQLKTLAGLKPVGSVLRYAEATQCDPLYLNPHSKDGAAGLANIARTGQVHIANALGSGALQNDAFMSFLPGLCESLLGETLSLPSLATWWCGQPEEAAYVRAHAGHLHISEAFARPELYAGNIENYQQASSEFSNLVHEPYNQVGRELINLSHAPYLNNHGQIAAGPTVLRLFVGLTANGYQLMPGGIARVGTEDGELSKDIWIPSDAAANVSAPTAPAAMTTRRSDRDLPSRTADDLFWLGRYLERCEGAVRAYRCLFSHVTEGNSDDQQMLVQKVVQLLLDLDMLSPQQARRLTQGPSTPLMAREWWNVLFNPNSKTGMLKLLGNIHRLANQVRERLSGDAWRMFNALAQTPQQQRWRLDHPSDALTLMDQLIERLSGLSGQIQENMTRSYGWRLLELGRRLERGQFALRVMDELVAQDTSSTYMYLLLDLCDSTITYRARYQSVPRLENLLHLLLLDESNPRSMIYQISQLQAVMAEMPMEQSSEGLSDAQRILLIAYHELMLAEPEKMTHLISKAGNRTQLRRVLNQLDTTLGTLSELVTATYFAHTLVATP